VVARRHVARNALLAAVLVGIGVALFTLLSGGPGGGDKTVCAYSSHSIASLNAFSRSIGRDVNCAVVFNNASPDWAGWEKPWFTRHIPDDNNWRAWATAPGKHRRLVITQGLFPGALKNTDWRTAGARGDYEQHARNLAHNLVTAGLGGSIIRLSHEANGTWNPDNIGSTQRDYDLWRRFWRNTVMAMRSVPGAHFKFDWTVNGRVRPIPLGDFYPGDDVVDIIGIDAYDSGIPAGQRNRWATVWGGRDGVRDVLAFARAHHRPLSIPEWGLANPATRTAGGGDDPAYVDGIANVVRKNDVAYQSYFFSGEIGAQLKASPRSIAAYRRHFGAHGDST
jgi:Glycosyl hydrolase family 26